MIFPTLYASFLKYILFSLLSAYLYSLFFKSHGTSSVTPAFPLLPFPVPSWHLPAPPSVSAHPLHPPAQGACGEGTARDYMRLYRDVTDCRLPALIDNKETSLSLTVSFYRLCLIDFLHILKYRIPAILLSHIYCKIFSKRLCNQIFIVAGGYCSMMKNVLQH